MLAMNKRIFYRIGLYTVAGFIAFTLYARANTPPETDQEYCDRTGRVKIHDRYFKYDVYEHGEMKPIVDMLSKDCNGNEYCEVDRIYKYVLSIPYKESSTNRNPSDVINQHGGDCDEKSFLLATLFLQKGYPCVFVTTKDHVFIAVHIPNEDVLKKPFSYLTIGTNKYYFAESTFSAGYIGQYNNVNQQEIDAIFDMVSKKEIPLDKVEFTITKR